MSAALAAATLAPAAAAESVDGRVRLSLEGSLLSYESVTLKADGSTAEVDVSQTTFGLAAPGLGPGIGFGLGDYAVAGARFLVFGTTLSVDNATESADSSGFSAQAVLAFLPVKGGSVRPFLGPVVGYRGSSGSTGALDTTSSTGVFGLTFGLYGFAHPAFSLDPSISLLYTFGSEHVGASMGVPELDAARRGLLISAGLAWSGWFGESAPSSAPTEEAETSAANAPSAAGPASGEAAAGQAPGVDAAGQDEITARMVSAAGDVLQLKWSRNAAADEAEFTYLVRHTPAQRCDSMLLQRGETPHPFSVESSEVKTIGSSNAVYTSGKVSIKTLALAARRKGDSLLVGCGRKWPLYDMDRKALRDFVRAVRQAQPQGAEPAAPQQEQPVEQQTPVTPSPEPPKASAPEAPAQPPGGKPAP